MTLVKRTNNLFPSFFDDFLTRDLFEWPKTNVGQSVPAVNIKEVNDKYEVEIAAPGLSKDDFNVELKNNVLTISSHKEEQNEQTIARLVHIGASVSNHRAWTFGSWCRMDRIGEPENPF